jgi:glutamate-1-semialdehyde 2,1-aminomutase
MNTSKSQQLFEEALRRIPGGVDSPVRAFKGVGGNPLFIKKAKGARLTDVDGNSFVDYVGSWGPMILGHAPRSVIETIRRTVRDGTSFGAPTEGEVRLAEAVCAAFPSVEQVRFVSSGTEAVMSAVRLARAFTQRKKIVKFDGCYHGHADHLLVKAGSGAATLGVPDSAGVPEEFTKETLVARYNDLASVEELFKKFPGQIAGVLIEPIVGNMGVILPQSDFLKKLKEICSREKTLLIFDEVMTGFRVAYGGAQELYGVAADLTTLGKVIGGGLPVGAYGGRKEIMQLVAPVGPMYQAGTLSGNPVAMAAGLATLEILKNTRPYALLNERTRQIVEGLKSAAQKSGLAVETAQAGSMFTLFFTEKSVIDADSARLSDTKKFAKFFHAMLSRGIYLPPSQFEASFVSTAHSEREIGKTLSAATAAFQETAFQEKR